MNANEMTFGIEIETTMPSDSRIVPGAYHVGNQVSWLPLGWTAQRDGSIRVTAGRIGVEFVSPVLKGAEGIAQVVDVVKLLNERGAAVNTSTGLHVHIGWTADAKALARLVSLIGNFEKAIFATTGTKSRECNHYCQSIQRHGNAAAAARASRDDRYHVLNLTNLNAGRKKTVEFRAFAGTTNVVKIVATVRLCLALVEKAVNGRKAPKFVAKPTVETSPVHRSGEGQTQLARLFYALGWTKGQSKYVFGNVTADAAPDLDACKAEFVRLAKKYDGETLAPATR